MAEWSIPFDVLAERTKRRLEDVVRESTIILFERVIMRSPVDTGRFRGNWFTSYAAPKVYAEEGTMDPSGGSTVNSMRTMVSSFPVGSIVYLTNSLPYSMVLEYGLYPNPAERGSIKRRLGETTPTIHTTNGFSNQAPAGMVRITAMEFQQAVNDAIERLST